MFITVKPTNYKLVQKLSSNLLTSERDIEEKVEEFEDLVVGQKDTKVEQMVREDDRKENLPMECQGAILSNEVACHCNPDESKGL